MHFRKTVTPTYIAHGNNYTTLTTLTTAAYLSACRAHSVYWLCYMLHSKGLGTFCFSEVSRLSLGPTQPASIGNGDSFPQGQCGG